MIEHPGGTLTTAGRIFRLSENASWFPGPNRRPIHQATASSREDDPLSMISPANSGSSHNQFNSLQYQLRPVKKRP